MGTSGQLEGEDSQERGSSSNLRTDDLENDDNESESAYSLAEPFGTLSEEWQLVRSKHTRKQRSVDVLNAARDELSRLMSPRVGMGHPRRPIF